MALSLRGEAEALAHLKSLNMAPAVINHAILTTVPAWAEELKTRDCQAALAKNLFVKDKNGELGLAFAMADTKTDLKVVAKTMGASVSIHPVSLLNHVGDLSLGGRRILFKMKIPSTRASRFHPLSTYHPRLKERRVLVFSGVLTTIYRLFCAIRNVIRRNYWLIYT